MPPPRQRTAAPGPARPGRVPQARGGPGPRHRPAGPRRELPAAAGVDGDAKRRAVEKEEFGPHPVHRAVAGQPHLAPLGVQAGQHRQPVDVAQIVSHLGKVILVHRASGVVRVACKSRPLTACVRGELIVETAHPVPFVRLCSRPAWRHDVPTIHGSKTCPSHWPPPVGRLDDSRSGGARHRPAPRCCSRRVGGDAAGARLGDAQGPDRQPPLRGQLRGLDRVGDRHHHQQDGDHHPGRRQPARAGRGQVAQPRLRCEFHRGHGVRDRHHHEHGRRHHHRRWRCPCVSWVDVDAVRGRVYVGTTRATAWQ